MQTFTLDTTPSLTKLQNKRFSQAYTPIPYHLFPDGEIERLYTALNITPELAPEPFTVSAYEDGTFKTLYTPTVMRNGDEVVVKFGSTLVPLSSECTLNFMGSITVFLSVSHSKRTVVLPVLFKEDAKVTAELLNRNPDNFINYLATAKIGGSTVSLYTVKVSDMPLGSYFIHDYNIFVGETYDTVYLRCVLNEQLSSIQVYNTADKKAEVVDLPVGTMISVRGNSRLVTFFKAKPIVTDALPAVLTVINHKTVMGKPSADVKIELSDVDMFDANTPL
jgi:hypothetical protein